MVQLKDSCAFFHGLESVRPRIVSRTENDQLVYPILNRPLRIIVEIPDPCADGVTEARQLPFDLFSSRFRLFRVLGGRPDESGIDKVDREWIFEADTFVFRQP